MFREPSATAIPNASIDRIAFRVAIFCGASGSHCLGIPFWEGSEGLGWNGAGKFVFWTTKRSIRAVDLPQSTPAEAISL